MKRVLLVKLTSMGDLIHALPAITDACHAIEDICFDWVADEGFAEIATWHPAVLNVITTAHRRWRKQVWQVIQSGEAKTFYKQLRNTSYDLIIDGQGNFKSAIVAWLARGPSAGLDKACAAEAIASLAYKHKYNVPKGQHAVVRLRQLFAKALDYSLPDNEPNYGISRHRFLAPALDLPKAYLFFVHNASWETKLWPEPYWADLIKMATDAGHHVLLPCGNQAELARAKRLAMISDKAIALPKLRLSEIAYIIAHAQGAVSVDTGLSHLCAAMSVPNVSLYGATDSGLIGAAGNRQVFLQAAFNCAPCYLKTCNYTGKSDVKPACFTKIPPTLVWKTLQAVAFKHTVSPSQPSVSTTGTI